MVAVKSSNFLAFIALATISISPIFAQVDLSEVPKSISLPIPNVLNLGGKPTTVISKGPDVARARKYNYITAATYCFDALNDWSCENCLKAKALGYDFVVQVNDPLMNTVAVIVMNHDVKEIVVAFRGTINLPNGFQDILLVPVPVTGIGFPLSTTQIRVHSGFLLAVNSLYAQLVSELQKLITANPDHSLVVVGHSLGAAMASVFLHKIMEKIDLPPTFPQPATFAFFGYGEPRVGNQPYADYWNSKDIEVTRVVHKRDIIPHVPLSSGLASGYTHHGTELWINPSDVDISCSKSVYEDPKCSNSAGPFYSLLDHLTYWDVEYANCALTMPFSFLGQFIFQ